MSVINSQPLIGASGNQSTAYNLTRSLRFRSSASAYLNRTFTTPTNAKKFTWSAWVKRGTLGNNGYGVLFANNPMTFAFNSVTTTQGSYPSDTLLLWDFGSNTYFAYCNPNPLLRDPSAWYHIVLAVDTTQATASNRVKIYINGTEFTTSVTISQNTDLITAASHQIGKSFYNPEPAYFDGYLSEVNFVDGQQLDASSFGETDTATGVWKPKKYTGTYGTNGFYLKFDNLTSTSTLGNDSSGNSNTWTVNNISLTSGSTYDSMKDVPTLTDADTANYCVINPLDTGGSTITNGNLTQTTPSTGYGSTRSTISVSSGKWYWEVTPTSLTGGAMIGICGVTETISSSTQLYNLATSYTYWSNANKGNNGSTASYGASYAANDVIGIALDLDGGTIEFYKNNSSQGTAYSSLSGTFTPAICDNSNSNASAFDVNFGQRPFAYTPPSGFKALNTFNLPTPTIGATASTQANDYFDATTYTGTGSSQSITNSGSMQPDFVWIKGRSGATDHGLYDAVRGVQKQLESNNTDAETTETTGLTAFNSNGFTVGALAQLNTSSATYVGWQWKANGAGSSNTAGSQTSTVSVNTTAGFSIATFTCTGLNVNGTVGHGLGVAPNMIITKSRGSGSNWVVYHSSVSTDVDKFLRLNDTSALTTLSQIWGDALPTSTVFGIRGDVTLAASATAVAYCFAQVAGYSAFGSYTGNGSTDGPFLYMGFRPKFYMYKRTDSTSNWVIMDSTRNPYNAAGLWLYPNLSNAENDVTSTDQWDFLSNGLKVRSNGSATNANGGTYIFAAFADTPFKYSIGR